MERRKFIRIPEHAQITYEVMPSPKIENYLTRDLSQGGIRFFVHEFIPPRSQLKVRIALHKIAFSFETLVRIAWIKEEPLSERYEVGGEFVDIPPEVARHLVEYIDFIRITLTHQEKNGI